MSKTSHPIYTSNAMFTISQCSKCTEINQFNIHYFQIHLIDNTKWSNVPCVVIPGHTYNHLFSEPYFHVLSPVLYGPQRVTVYTSTCNIIILLMLHDWLLSEWLTSVKWVGEDLSVFLSTFQVKETSKVTSHWVWLKSTILITIHSLVGIGLGFLCV